MILKNYYEQKKQAILNIFNETGAAIGVELFSDSVFTNTAYSFPLVLFKYHNVVWTTSSEKEYKADVNFSVCIVLPPSQSDYLEVFDIAKKVDEAILLHPNNREIKDNQTAISTVPETVPLIANAALKVSEGQYVVEDDFWEKNNFFIWEINYKTTLIEKEYKKRYTMITNGFFTEAEVTNNEEEIRSKLSAIGFDLNEYHLVERDGKKLLIFKEIEEQLAVNAKI